MCIRDRAKAGVNHFHAGIAEGASDNFCAAIVTVEAGFGDQDSDFLFGHLIWVVSVLSPNKDTEQRCVKKLR